MDERPTVYLSNWASHRTPGHHGPGRKLTIMARPRRWEHGEGRVGYLVPDPADVAAVKAGELSLEEYRARYEEQLRAMADRGNLAPDQLSFRAPASGPFSREVRDGDTLCCACSTAAAAQGACHRVWAAAFLARAGWRVVLDGEEFGG